MKTMNYNKDTFPLQTLTSSIIIAAVMALFIVLLIALLQ